MQCHFSTDCAAINAACANDPNAIVGAGLLTLLSVKKPFYRMQADFANVQAVGLESPYLYGWKRRGARYLLDNAERFFDAANLARGKDDAESLESLLFTFLEMPGLGLAKASFLAQLTTGRGACLDSHNLAGLGFSEDEFKLDKKSLPRTILKHMRAYNAAWSQHGDSAFWWNQWCDHVAALYPNKFANGAEVSKNHLVALQWKGLDGKVSQSNL